MIITSSWLKALRALQREPQSLSIDEDSFLEFIRTIEEIVKKSIRLKFGS